MKFTISDVIPASPMEIYQAWLDSAGHSAMTGSPAQVSGEVGQAFEAWDGYILGQNLELEPGRRILQAWRTTDFEPSDQDSFLEVLLEPSPAGTKVTINHSRLPSAGDLYRQGWVDYYFEPMKIYFGNARAADTAT